MLSGDTHRHVFLGCHLKLIGLVCNGQECILYASLVPQLGVCSV